MKGNMVPTESETDGGHEAELDPEVFDDEDQGQTVASPTTSVLKLVESNFPPQPPTTHPQDNDLTGHNPI